MEVPAVLLSGDHRRIERWRRRESLRATRDRRPDLFARLRLSEDDRRLMEAGDDEL
jgi:tRNA (guanine37-N1)-methyltransferase